MPNHKLWPFIAFFGVYDGHGGNMCANYLQENLHTLIIQDEAFLDNPKLAIKNGCALAEKNFMKIAEKGSTPLKRYERSGSCACFAIIIGKS